MPNLNSMEPGDVPYPQYAVITTETVLLAVPIVKGSFYTKNSDGLIVPVSTTFEFGFYQAMVTVTEAEVIANNYEAQFLNPRSRMIIPSGQTSLHPGHDVILNSNITSLSAGSKTSALYLGKIFEIYSRNTDSTKKLLTIVDDLVIVDTVFT